MDLIELYYKLALFGTNTTFIILVAIFTLFYVDKKVAINSLMFAIFSIFINQYLKSIWQVPMDPSLGKEGWAFPSGHTQLNIVFWGSLLWQLRSKYLAVFLLVLLPSSYFAMVDAKYHTWEDIAGGIITGFVMLILFVLCYQYALRYIKSISMCILFVCCVLFWLLPEQPHQYFWLWFYLGCLLPIVLMICVNCLSSDVVHNKKEKACLFICAISVVAFISLYTSREPSLLFMQGFSLAFSTLFLVQFLYNMIKGRFQK